MTHDPFSARHVISTPLGERVVYRLDALAHMGDIESLPYSIKVLLESVLRNHDGVVVRDQDITAVAQYDASKVTDVEIAYKPGRVVLQDFTGVPAVVDLAAMRSAIVRMTGDEEAAAKVNPQVQADLVIDHSVQVDAYNTPDALGINADYEFERNKERYEFLKWGQEAFDNFSVVPPATGIVHQVNLEYLAKVVWEDDGVLYPDSLVGTDSHTTMINGLGIVGWGVGGIEAEAVMVGQPIYMLLPEVVGFKLTGALPDGATATDLVLRVTEMLRAHGVVGKFVEFYGPGLSEMPVANRATLANMAPEYGATIGFFPVDDLTLDYMRLSGRPEDLIATVEQYYKMQGMWRDDSRDITYSSTLGLDMSTVVPSLAGPKRPQDRIALTEMKQQWRVDIDGQLRPDGGGPGEAAGVEYGGASFDLVDGDVVIAAITSCTNTSNPEVMIAAGLLARNAREKGLNRKPWVKTSLAPGSKVVTAYLESTGLLEDLESIGFFTVGYGCTTCIGNSGPLPDPISAAIRDNDLVATSVLSGNRNFEGRISPDVRANYLASPPLVVAYAIAGTVDIDLATEPLGQDRDGGDVFLADIWPAQAEILDTVTSSVTTAQFTKEYGSVYEGPEMWRAIKATGGALYAWDETSTYIQEPPFFMDLPESPKPIAPITGARVLLWLGDSITTDHISPAGAIGSDTPAGRFLIESGVDKVMFNSYGSRRGNDRVMTRGTFANIRVRNRLAPGTEGGWTTDFTDGEVRSVYEASLNYKDAGTPLVVLGGSDYGMGSSRDWAAKGTFLLGVRAVIAESYERIHRSNLVMMGVVPLEFPSGQSADSLGLDGTETFDIALDDTLTPRQGVQVTATKADGGVVAFTALVRVDTPIEVEYLRHGGILHMVLRQMAATPLA
ncbi:MAG: aconitate hydratase AcnA [Actinomycetota bacterium]|nr:aconitate hydratase AcnA [Actinomycetota bacterium]MDK1038923.1 aconitate hydratase AcnA [Actinomycetota bacterium]MDK1097640.1 aconitate hydratase AcnA [Actinomycetota bacterium]MDK1104156.1 aconitate hydratase AcnA [Actinomycetota bacterium]MDK1292205.1 aconitate hydratase AcnA [Actinomycetota bacterium]